MLIFDGCIHLASVEKFFYNKLIMNFSLLIATGASTGEKDKKSKLSLMFLLNFTYFVYTG